MGYNPFGQLSMNELALVKSLNGGNEINLLGATPFGQLSNLEMMKGSSPLGQLNNLEMMASSAPSVQTDPIIQRLIQSGNMPMPDAGLYDPEYQRYLEQYAIDQQRKLDQQNNPTSPMQSIVDLLDRLQLRGN